MSQPIDREGIFRAAPVEVGLREFDSGAVAVSVRFGVLEHFGAAGWEDWRQYQVEVYADLFVVKRDKTINEPIVRAMMLALGWNGSLADLAIPDIQLRPCQVDVRAEQYNGATSYRAKWVNPWDHIAGAGVGNVNADRVRALQSTHGGALRAIAGNIARNATAPPPPTTGQPGQAPAPPSAQPVPAGTADDPGLPTGDRIPF